MSVSYPDKLEIQPLTKPPVATIRVPGSKSITNRALVLAALCSRHWPSLLVNSLRSEDTEVMIGALRQLGFVVKTVNSNDPWISVQAGTPRTIPAGSADLFVGNSGTSMRFLTALASLGHGRYRLDGVSRMRERPIADLLDALCQLGVEAHSELSNGCPPVIVESNGWKKTKVSIKGTTSSQFLSGLLMAAPFASQDTMIEVDGPMVSEPYVEMTVRMMLQWHLGVERPTKTTFKIPGRQEPPPIETQVEFTTGQSIDEEHFPIYSIEPDASAASYFFAASAIAKASIPVLGLTSDSIQGDVRFVDVLRQMGCSVARSRDGITVWSRSSIHGIDVDMNDISDTVMTLAAVACFAEGPTHIRNVAHIRHKETDRLAALATELRKVGAEVDEYPDGLKITPRSLHGAVIDTYNDHRMAMSMALIGLKVPGIVINNPGCVAKTYPNFFEDLEKLRS